MFESSTPTNKYTARKEFFFLLLVGLFLGSLTMLNILGISRILDLSFNIFSYTIPFKLTIGVLAYPLTFLCTDLISELYGQKRANSVVWIGLILNLWVFLVLWLGAYLPKDVNTDDTAFLAIKNSAYATISASMVAYLLAQFCDVKIFHFLKKLTKGKHLWLRNNVSTLTSQLVDSIAVMLIAHYQANAFNLKGQDDLFNSLLTLILSSYLFKFVVALLDTIPFYLLVKFLSTYLNINTEKDIS